MYDTDTLVALNEHVADQRIAQDNGRRYALASSVDALAYSLVPFITLTDTQKPRAQFLSELAVRLADAVDGTVYRRGQVGPASPWPRGRVAPLPRVIHLSDRSNEVAG